MSDKPDIRRLLEFQKLLVQFQHISRVTHIPGSWEAENDTEHSYNLAMTAWFLAPHFPQLDCDKLIRYALVHDLVEVHAGDTYIYADEATLASKPHCSNWSKIGPTSPASLPPSAPTNSATTRKPSSFTRWTKSCPSC